MKIKIRKGAALVITGILSLALINGCSTTNESGLKLHGLISRFGSHLRPVQGNPDSHYLLACYYQVRGEHEKALEELNKVLLIDPKNIKALNGMGLSYDQLKDYSHAQAVYRKALELNPGLAYVQNNLGYSYLLDGRIDEAISILQKAIAINRNEASFHNNLGLAFAAKDRLDLALDEFKLAGNESQAHFNIAQFYYRQGKYQAAKDHYSNAVKLNPAFTRAKLASGATGAIARIFRSQEKKCFDIAETKTDSLLPVENRPLKEKPALDKITVIEVSNGNGVNGAASRFADYLRNRGLGVKYITNADHFNHPATIIYYQKEYREKALQLAGRIPGRQNIKQGKNFGRPQTDVKIVIGKDILYARILNKV